MFTVVVNGVETDFDGMKREFQLPSFFVEAFNRHEAEVKAMRILRGWKNPNTKYHVSVEKSILQPERV